MSDYSGDEGDDAYDFDEDYDVSLAAFEGW